MIIRPIRTDEDHAAALQRIDRLMDAKAGTPEADELDVLVTLVEVYEERRFPISEVLNGRRALSLQMIRRLNHELGIPLESLVGRD